MYSEKELQQYANSMKNEPTFHEKLFKSKFKSSGLYYETQVVIGFYIADFVLPDKMVIIELDGKQHKEKDAIRHDKYRDEFLTKLGFKVIRIDNTLAEDFDIFSLLELPDFTFDDYFAAKDVGRSKYLKKYNKLLKKYGLIKPEPKLTDEQKRKRKREVTRQRKKRKSMAKRGLIT